MPNFEKSALVMIIRGQFRPVVGTPREGGGTRPGDAPLHKLKNRLRGEWTRASIFLELFNNKKLRKGGGKG